MAFPEVLGMFYFRVWRHRGWWYALGKSRLYRSADILDGYEPGPIVLEVEGTTTADMNEPGNIRHTAVIADGDTLTVYYTKQADAPGADSVWNDRYVRTVVRLRGRPPCGNFDAVADCQYGYPY